MELKFIDNNKAAMLSGDPTMDPGFDEYDIAEEKENFKMTKAELKKLMDKHCILPSELEDVFDFVSEVLYMRRKELEANEPYATKTIDELLKAEHEVYDLIAYVNEIEEEE
jgi:hypothetical protein